jgi:chlorobactene glucosyltransferase
MVPTISVMMFSILVSSMLFVCIMWLYFMICTVRSLRQSPKLGLFHNQTEILSFENSPPRVSIIIPARNEEGHIRKCLDSLLNQNYSNVEIVAVNDSSSDSTREIMQEYYDLNKSKMTIIVVNADDKPEGWSGKNWACYHGYLRSSGDLFLFLDADTILLSSSTISMAVAYFRENNLDTLTVRPKLLCQDTWAKITLPMLLTLLYMRHSVLRIKNPQNKTSGYLYGCFYLITRKIYEAIGTHRAVKDEIIEDAAIGRRIRNQNYVLRAVSGDRYIESIFRGRWNVLQRIVVPRYQKRKTATKLVATGIFFLTLYPFILLPFLFSPISTLNNNDNDLFFRNVVITINLLAIAIIISTSLIQLKFGIFENLIYALASPIAGTIISLGFIFYIIDARINDTLVDWRGRKYTMLSKRNL